jgi:hypothetical protein
VSPCNAFVFEFDFETAVPPNLLHAALKNLGELTTTDQNTFREIVNAETGPVGPKL